jgi:hypothetical protein
MALPEIRKHSPFSFRYCTYDPTNLTIRSAAGGPFFISSIRFTMSRKVSTNALSPVNFVETVPFFFLT